MTGVNKTSEINPANNFLEMEVNKVEVSVDSSFVEVISKTGDGINETLLKLETTLSSFLQNSNNITLTQVCFAAFVAFIGALSAYLFNLFHWKMVEKKRKIARQCFAVIALIDDLEKISVAYWVKDYNAEEIVQIHAEEISIKAKRHLMSKYIKLLSSDLRGKQTSSIKMKLEELDDEIFELLTGDGFETASRVGSKPRAFKIAKRFADVKVAILSLEFYEE